MTKLIVGVYNEADYNTLRQFQLNADIQVVRILNAESGEIDPIFLPASLVRSIQQHGFDEEYVYFTEADQILYVKDWNNVYNTIDNDKNIYIVPQRFEQIPHAAIAPRIEKYADTTEDRFIDFDGVLKEDNNKYVVANEPVGPTYRSHLVGHSSEKVFPVNQVYDYDDYFYVNPSPHTTHVDAPEYGQAYGAAFLCHRELFNRVTFINSRFMIKGRNGIEFPYDYQPTETPAGHDLLRTQNSICLKSRDFFYFHVDHLSGYEFNKTLEVKE